jgi:RNA exonuclease 1
MLKSLYDHYLVLYQNILTANPTLASDHALKQEEEVYKKSSKLTYRNVCQHLLLTNNLNFSQAVISSIAALKRRSVPDSISHESVGTESNLLSRQQSKKSIEAFRLTPAHLDSLLLSTEDMIKWDYIIEVPSGVGGEMPSEEGRIMPCERCRQPRQVKRLEEAEECVYHWGRPFSTRLNGMYSLRFFSIRLLPQLGEKVRIYSCCSQPTTSAADGCSRGPHVFYESKPEDLNRRHLFSYTRSPTTPDSALDVAALDCEMVYTTGGMRVARVSVVDASGTEGLSPISLIYLFLNFHPVFDELVRMDDGVHIMYVAYLFLYLVRLFTGHLEIIIPASPE